MATAYLYMYTQTEGETRTRTHAHAHTQNAETHPLCLRLDLAQLMPIAWQRLTKYKLLIDNILATYKKHWDELNGERTTVGLFYFTNI